MAAFVAHFPMRRFGRPEGVAAVAAMLASDENVSISLICICFSESAYRSVVLSFRTIDRSVGWYRLQMRIIII